MTIHKFNKTPPTVFVTIVATLKIFDNSCYTICYETQSLSDQVVPGSNLSCSEDRLLQWTSELLI